MKLHPQPSGEDKKAKQLIDVIAEKIRLKQTARIDQTLALVKGAVATPAMRVKASIVSDAD